MDPLVRAGFHNLTCSPLCRLPEEILLHIMEDLGFCELACLRRASRLFLRLCSSPEFRGGQREDDEYRHYTPWITTWAGSKADEQVLKDLLVRDRNVGYCEECTASRAAPGWAARVGWLGRKVYCSGCKVEHPRWMFMPRQRPGWCSLHQRRQRCCAARTEGVGVRLCEHRIISWREINKGRKRLKWLKSHRELLVTCDDESHLPRHQYSGNSIDLADLRPTAYLVAATPTSPVILDRRWVGHLSVWLPDDRQDGRVTADEVRSALERLRQGAAEFIAPERAPGCLLEMSCFDPNRCRCLSFPGMDQLPPGWHLSPGGAHFNVRCRSRPGGRLGPLVQVVSGEGVVRGTQRWVIAEEHTTKQMSHSRYYLDTPITQISPSECISDKQCIAISYSSAVAVGNGSGGAVTRAWHEALDPGSYCLTGDAEAYGLLWCWTPGCRNYYRYSGRAAHITRTDLGVPTGWVLLGDFYYTLRTWPRRMLLWADWMTDLEPCPETFAGLIMDLCRFLCGCFIALPLVPFLILMDELTQWIE